MYLPSFFNYNSTLNPITRKGHTMKIVMIHGQNRKGSTYHIGRLFAQKLSPENDVTEFFFAGFKLFLSWLLYMY